MDTLLQPFKFNIPFFTDYLADAQRYKKELLDYSSQTVMGREDESALHRSILSISAGEKLNLSSWEAIIGLLIRQSLDKSGGGVHHHIRDRWSEVKAHFEDPFFSYFNTTKTYRLTHRNQEPFNNPTFDALFLEITRDNIVTETERSFLNEKARVYGVSETLLAQALAESNPALNSFVNFVLEVCRDGIVTENEYRFLEEKATYYNIPESIMNSLLEDELQNARRFIALRESREFYDLVNQCLIIDFVSRESTQLREIVTAIEALPSSPDGYENNKIIQKYIELNRSLIIELVESRTGHELPNHLSNLRTREWVTAFGFEYTPFEDVGSRAVRTTKPNNWHEEEMALSEPLQSSSNESLFHLCFNGFKYYFIDSDSTRSLFTYQVNGSKIFVSVSSRHHLYPPQNQKPLFKFIVTLIAAKMMDERIAIDDFFDTLHFLQTRITKDSEK